MSIKFVLDASAIIISIERMKDKVIDIFKESLTPTLAFYEIGNFLWKTKRKDLVKDFLNVLKFINVEDVGLNEEIVDLALKEKLTYYDATYLYLSKKRGLILVSEDKDLISKGAIRVDEIMKFL